MAEVKRLVERFLRLLGIYDDRYRTFASLSKGMRQKILIAAAMLHDPRLVILDEPFSGLDVSAARVLKAFVRALADDGRMVVFSSHVLEVVEQVCSRVLILKDGRVAGQDSVMSLRSTLQLPSLDAVFAALAAEEDADERACAMVAAMKAWPCARQPQPGVRAAVSRVLLTALHDRIVGLRPPASSLILVASLAAGA
jgi:ABC-2 type transport system ATP-binding protein